MAFLHPRPGGVPAVLASLLRLIAVGAVAVCLGSGLSAEPQPPGEISASEEAAPAPVAAAQPAARPLAETPAPETVESLRAEMSALCRRQTAGDNPYFGEAPVAELEGRLRIPDQSLEVQVGIRARLGKELLRLGRPGEAVERLEEALTLARENGLPLRLTLQVERDLALALLQLAEDENCVARHAAGSCILPIGPDAVHPLPASARRAGDLYQHYLTTLARHPSAGSESTPADIAQVRWLLAFARMISGGYPAAMPAPLRPAEGALAPEAPFPLFVDRAAALGVDALDLSGGAVADDFDGDGLIDLITSTWDPCGSMKAFRNDGAGGFDDVTAAWGLDGQLGGLNLTHADFDGDGDLDLLLLRGAWQGEAGETRNSLLENDLSGASGRFLDVTRRAGMAHAFPTQNAAWADFDGDGDLDVFVGAESPVQSPVGGPGSYPSRLYRNDGDGAFTDVAEAAGVAASGFAKGSAWGDFDDDGRPDLYVSSFGPNRLYRNRGDGTFEDVAEKVGVTMPDQSFATWFFDFDNDGDLDLFAADYGAPFQWVSASYLGHPVAGGHPRLYRNDGDGGFTDVSAEVGLSRPLLPMGANHGDLDGDGFEDIYLGTGVPDLEAVMPNVLYRNDAGRRLVDVTFSSGLGHVQKGHGVAFADFDGDGDLDLAEQMGGAYPVDAYFNALYENPVASEGRNGEDRAGEGGPRFLTLRLRGKGANPFGLGARLEVRVTGPDGERRSVHRLVGSGGSFGGSSFQQELGLGDAKAVEAVVVRWPGSTGKEQTWTGLDPGGAYLLIEGEAEAERLEVPRFRLQRENGPPQGGPHAGHDAGRDAGDGDSGPPHPGSPF